MHKTLGTLCLLIAPLAAQGQVFSYSFGGGDIPDASPLPGLSLSGTVPADVPEIVSLRVTLSISGSGGNAYNGDLYATLVHDTGVGDPGFAVLLNRPGARAGDPFGYGDNGLLVTFDDAGAAPDIHNYRLTLSGNHNTAIPAPGQLTGTWSADGREVDPGSVLDSSSRTAGLGSFVGLDPAGTWSLYVEDMSGGGVAKVDYWTLEITGPSAPVPEPGEWTWAAGLGLGGFLVLRRRQRNEVRPGA